MDIVVFHCPHHRSLEIREKGEGARCDYMPVSLPKFYTSSGALKCGKFLGALDSYL